MTDRGDSQPSEHDQHRVEMFKAIPPAVRMQTPHGRAFYESIGGPKKILAPMVDQSEFAWRLLTRSFMPPTEPFLAYTPMLHARLFADTANYRKTSFQATRPAPAPETSSESRIPGSNLYLDGNPANDRPLIVQFCANSPDHLLTAAQLVQPYCDAVDLNLGCPQGIARKGHYGAFLQEDWDLIYKLINRLHNNLSVPVTAKIRVLETKEKSLEYARMVLSAGASILTVHGRTRDQKGHNTGLADWSKIRYLRDKLPPETVIFANGNILTHDDIDRCLHVTGADAVMSAEGNLCDPAIFATPPAVGEEGREYWRGRDGKGGFRVDAVVRRYMDIIYGNVLEISPPKRKPLFLPPDVADETAEQDDAATDQPPSKRIKLQIDKKPTDPNLHAMKAHFFSLLKPLITKHTDIRDALAKCRPGDLDAFENVLSMVENVTKDGLLSYAAQADAFVPKSTPNNMRDSKEADAPHPLPAPRPVWICQPYVRPLPKEAYKKGALSLSKKEKVEVKKATELKILEVGVGDEHQNEGERQKPMPQERKRSSSSGSKTSSSSTRPTLSPTLSKVRS